jgi:hypothetical protein
MSTWIIPNDPNSYDIRKGLVKYGSQIEWTKKLQTTNISTGDVVYIYIKKPAMKLTMKFVVTNQHVTTPNQTHDNNGTVIGDSWFKIEFLQEIEPISYETLLNLGIVNGYIQGARILNPEQENILNRYIEERDSGEGLSLNDLDKKATTPKPYSKEGCVFCDNLTQDRQYSGSLREYRTSDRHTMPWTDSSSGVRLTRTLDFFVDTGEVFRGGEITHSKRVHDAVSNSKNLISFTVTSRGNKRYVLTQEDGIKTSIIYKLQSNKDMTTDEIAEDIATISNLSDIEDVLKTLRTSRPPQRIERVVYKIVRNSKIAQLVKEKQKYICEVCGREPFIQKNGKPYAEADHIEPLGGDYKGLDTPENMRCLCAQCHAVITCGSDKVIKELLRPTKWQS